MACDVSVARQRWMLSPTGASADRDWALDQAGIREGTFSSVPHLSLHGRCAGGSCAAARCLWCRWPVHSSSNAASRCGAASCKLRRADALPRCRCADWQTGRGAVAAVWKTKIGHPPRRMSPNPEGAFSLDLPTSRKAAVGNRESGVKFARAHGSRRQRWSGGCGESGRCAESLRLSLPLA
jgi:hypothetical protein